MAIVLVFGYAFEAIFGKVPAVLAGLLPILLSRC
jgi:hypothetical protein